MDLDIDLIKKYNVQGPRYTSYPTSVQFGKATEGDRLNLDSYLTERNKSAREISLYFHIPFCFSLCWYCGCTKIITKDQDRGDHYLNYLEKEMDMISEILHKDSKIVQIHFGGGTPTFLKPKQLLHLRTAIRNRFNIRKETEFGVEIDPRRCSREHIKALKNIGCNRASLGVQDTNKEVQEAIHRIQPFEQTEKITRWLREEGIFSINFDLIYGLPRQTLETFRTSIDDVLQLHPDRLAMYSYAHLPQRIPAQKLIKNDEMPTTDEKLAMLQLCISHLTGNGYRFIGMDHFSKEVEELSRAREEGTLQRNFQGYSTHSGADLYAFGMSGISNVGEYYWQNSKDLGAYYSSLDEKKLPIEKLLNLCRDDKIRKDVIMKIMCRKSLSFEEIEEKWGITFERYFGNSLERLAALQSDGLITIDSHRLLISDTGRLFLRNIAGCFDRYFQEIKGRKIFSKTI